MLQVKDVALHRGDRLLFDGLSLTVHSGHKAGIVGRNGVGKTTLFELARGRLRPERGDVLLPDSWRVAALEQNVEPSPRPALAFVLDGDRRLRQVESAIAEALRREDDHALAHLYGEFEDAGGYDAEARGGEILAGLGFAPDDLDKPHAAFSGGWRIRLNLAQALMAPSDLLLLDEPTNHLDLDATLWLESWTRKYQGTLLAIAHDRDFLDRTMHEIVHIENGAASVYTGGYSAFEQQRADALLRQAANYKNQQRRIEDVQRFVDRFRAKASKAKQVQSRVKALERMDRVAPVIAESPYRFAFLNPKRISNPTLALDDAALGYDAATVLEGLTLRVYPGDRIGVLGANGAGKTTLLRCLAGVLEPCAGRFSQGRHASVGYFAQHQLESLDLAASPLDHIDAMRTEAGAPPLTEQQSLDYLGGWGFRGTAARRVAGTFSGGEKARLVLAGIACTQPAVLVLDEPTNHLDLDMREALAVALQQYEGALLLVSHDRHLLRECVDQLWIVAHGGVSRFGGDVDAYTSGRAPGSKAQGANARPPGQDRTAASPRRRPRSRKRNARGTELRRLQQKLARIEARMTAETSSVAALEQRLAKAAAEGDAQTIAALAGQRAAAKAQLEATERAWLGAQERIDRLAEPAP